MTISGSELSRMTSSGGLQINTTGTGWQHVNGITATQSQNITGTLHLDAQGSGEVSFITAASTFNALTAESAGGTINVGANLNTTNDPIQFLINSGGGNITFQDTLALDNDLTLTTGNGALTFGGAVDSNKTLTLNLGGGSVSGLGQLQSALTGLTVNSSSGITLPAFTISGPQVYNTGSITVTGDLGGNGIAFNNAVSVVPASGTALVIDAGSGTLAFANTANFNANNMTLTADEINFANFVNGSGSLLLQPHTGSRNVKVGGGSAITGLNLTAAEMAWLPIGTLSSLTIGRAAGSGSLELAGTINAPATPLTLNGGGGISQSGGAVKSGNLTLYAAGNAISLNSATNAFGAVGLNGSPTALTLVNTADITQLGSAAWNLAGAPVALNAGTHAIVLDNVGNTFGTVSLTGGTAHLTEADATDLGASTIGGDLGIVSTGVVTQSAAITVGGNLDVTTSVAAGDVTIDNTGGSATTLGNTLVGGDYTVVASGDPISQAAGRQPAGARRLHRHRLEHRAGRRGQPDRRRHHAAGDQHGRTAPGRRHHAGQSQ